jgi:hypothetical protein
MKMIRLLAALAALSIAATAQTPTRVAQKPQEVTFRNFSGDDLVKLCENGSADEHTLTNRMCLMYVSGFTDGYNVAMLKFNNQMQANFCPPNEVTPDEMAKVIVRYGSAHPEQLKFPAALFLPTALKDAYPCQAQ